MKYLFRLAALAVAFILNISTMQAQTSAYPETGNEQLAVIHTPYGDMTVKLYNQTPQHRDNFIKLVKAQMYDNTLFHRVIKDFMIQGGDPKSKNAAPGEMLGTGDLGYTVPAEFVPGLLHKKGALAAARQGDNVNPRKESSASQFYIVQGRIYTPREIEILKTNYGVSFTPEQEQIYTTVGGTPHLDGQYTVFGEVIDGMEVIDRIAAQATDGNNRPVEDIPMTITLQ
ncbi:MAG: peptidylprolyl isomerase [Bacteroidales bacterium]|nr:peptidylprolyl isomerase [Bacteroidales bacterium]